MARSKSRKIKRRRKQKQFDGLRNKLRQSLLQDWELVINPSGEVKMSEVLIDFIEPYLEFADTKEDYRKLVILGITAWNTSLLPKEEQQDMVDSIFNQFSKEMPIVTKGQRRKLEEIVNTLIVRKKAYFSEYTRAIISYDLTDTGDGYYLSVASTLEGTSS